MNRIWASAVILVLLAVICGAGLFTTVRITDDMSRSLSAAYNAAESGNDAEAVRLSDQTSQYWLKAHKIMCTYVPHNRLEAIDETISGLSPLIAHGSLDQFSAECAKGIRQIKFLKDLEIPSIENIL